MGRGSARARRRWLLRGFAAITLISMAGCRCTCRRDIPTPAPAANTVEQAPKHRDLPPGPRSRVLTYNVLGDESLADDRLPALMNVLRDADADILAFQEVTSWFLESLHRQPWVEGYEGTTIEGERAWPDGLYILSRYPMAGDRTRPLPGNAGRTALVADIRVQDISVRVANAHLESELSEWDVRAAQLEVVFDSLRDADHALLVGDFNFGDGEPEQSRLEPTYRDLWLMLRPREKGYTFDLERNDLARENAYMCETSRRLDRILLRSREWRAGAIELVGDVPLEGEPDVFPSDHFALLAELVLPGGWVEPE